MNVMVPMKTLKRMLLLGCLMGAAPFAAAVNYTNSDLFLIFRKDGFNDVEFDLGPVSNFLGLSTGSPKAVDFDAALVKANFNDSLADVKFLLVAASGLDAGRPRLWLSDVSASSVPSDFTLSKFTQVRSKVSAMGQQASVLTGSNALPAVIATSQPGSFTYIASDANLTPAASLGGLTGFSVEAPLPATLRLFEFQMSATTPRPPAVLIGSFTMDSVGTLTFTAGDSSVLAAPTLSGITRRGEIASISFATVTGLKYELRYATSATGSFTSIGNVLTGDGGVQTLSDTSSDPVRFYKVQASR